MTEPKEQAVPVVGVEEAVERLTADLDRSGYSRSWGPFSGDLRKVLDRLQALQDSSACADTHRATEQPVVGWRPIESAPRDGTEFLAYRPDQGVFVCRFAWLGEFINDSDLTQYDDGYANWFHDLWGWLENDLTPTFWTALPAGPSDSGEAALGGDGDAAWDRFNARFTLNCEAVIDDAGRVDFSDALIAAQDAVGRYGLTLLASDELRADLKQYTGRADDAGRLAREVISLLDQSAQNQNRKLGGDEAEGGVNKDLQAQLKAAYEALEPFAKAADALEPSWADHETNWADYIVDPPSAGDLRRARQALARRGEG